MQCTQKIAIIGMPIDPTVRPAFLNASGIANIPVPMFPLRRCITVSKFLGTIRLETIKFSETVGYQVLIYEIGR